MDTNADASDAITTDQIVERFSWLEWDDKVAVFDQIVEYLGHDFASGRVSDRAAWLDDSNRAKDEMERWKAEILAITREALRSRARALSRTCPACGYAGLFQPYGWPVRPEAKCTNCGCLERHRLLKLWLQTHPDELKNKSVLHFAPESAVSAMLRPLAAEYVTADFRPGAAELRLNIEAIDLPEHRFDAVVCSHVLEHVDDSAALAEIYRVLKPGGLGIIMIPVVEGMSHSYEDETILTEEDREVHFGQSDHIRVYGADCRARIVAAGFMLDEFTAAEPESLMHGLLRGEKVFLLRRPGSSRRKV